MGHPRLQTAIRFVTVLSVAAGGRPKRVSLRDQRPAAAEFEARRWRTVSISDSRAVAGHHAAGAGAGRRCDGPSPVGAGPLPLEQTHHQIGVVKHAVDVQPLDFATVFAKAKGLIELARCLVAAVDHQLELP
jgi:hypothetical protein